MRAISLSINIPSQLQSPSLVCSLTRKGIEKEKLKFIAHSTADTFLALKVCYNYVFNLSNSQDGMTTPLHSNNCGFHSPSLDVVMKLMITTNLLNLNIFYNEGKNRWNATTSYDRGQYVARP